MLTYYSEYLCSSIVKGENHVTCGEKEFSTTFCVKLKETMSVGGSDLEMRQRLNIASDI